MLICCCTCPALHSPDDDTKWCRNVGYFKNCQPESQSYNYTTVAFTKLGGLRAVTSAPSMVLTATASPETQQFICQSLQLVNPHVVSCLLNQPTIYFSASISKGFRVSTCMNMYSMYTSGVAQWLKSYPPASVPNFVQTKNVGSKVYDWLSQCASSKYSVGFYHASLTQTTKAHLQSVFRKECDLR